VNNNDLYSVDFTRSLPPVLKNNAEMAAAAQAIAEQLHITANLISQNIIYARIDELDEATLDILAYDLHVDWYDYSYPVEVKRQTIKNSVKVHRKLGTKYAVETALGAVFPGARVEEWFEYGGAPYLFRVAADVPEEGVTAEQQRRAFKKVQFYKNLRSHLECIEFETESTGFVRVAAFSTAGEVMEIWPELTTLIEVAAQAGTSAATAARHTVEIFPELVECLTIEGQAGTSGGTAARQVVEIFPESGQ
jgi:phage tail P2-like protein